jgi:hypothetical protein
MNKNTSRFPKIEISSKRKVELAAKHEVTLQTVRNALKFYYDTELAKTIRQEATEMLEEDTKNAKNLIK